MAGEQHGNSRFRLPWKEPAQRERFDRWTLALPGIGPIARKFSTSQAARTLATLLGGGIPLVNAIDVASSMMPLVVVSCTGLTVMSAPGVIEK